MVDERTELLINRKLDGELRDGELLELNRLLIRSPEARRMLEEYEHDDRLAASAVQAAVEAARPPRGAAATGSVARPPQGAAATFAAAPGRSRPVRSPAATGSASRNAAATAHPGGASIGFARFAPIAGLAAAVALVFLTTIATPRGGTIRQGEARPASLGGLVEATPVNVVPVAAPLPALADLMDGPRRERQRLVRDVLGVVDPETRSIYFLQVDSTHTTVEPDVIEY